MPPSMPCRRHYTNLCRFTDWQVIAVRNLLHICNQKFNFTPGSSCVNGKGKSVSAVNSSCAYCFTQNHCLPTHVGRLKKSVVHVPSLLQLITGFANFGIRTYPSLHCMTARSPGMKPPDFSTTTPLAMSGSGQPPITAHVNTCQFYENRVQQ